ncbi:MAG: MFS transporter [Rhodobacteraceae bacterium]|nr:MFS transporter [Paracoccaceae bacterium]
MTTAGASLRHVLILWLAGLGAAAQFAKVSVFFPELQALYPGTGAWLGFLVSLISLIGIAFGLLAGMIVARSGAQRLLVPALLFGAAISLFQAGLPSLPVMLLSRVFEGLSHLVIVVAAPTLIAERALPQHRPYAMTLWSSFFGVTFAAMVWAGQPLVARHGLAAMFLAHGAYMVVMAGAVWAGVARDRGTGPGLGGVPPVAEIWRQHVRVYRSPYEAAPGLGWLCYTLTFVALMTVLPEFLDPQVRTSLIGLLPLASIASALLLGVVLIRHVGGVTSILIGFALSALFLLAQLAAPGAPLLCLGLFAALGIVQSASFAAIPELNPTTTARAHATGAIAQMGNLGNTLGTPVLLVLTGALGFSGLILFGITAYGLGIAVHLAAARKRRALQAGASPLRD